MTKPFLLEIGTEEIPDWMIPPALEDMRRRFEALLAEHRLGGQVSWVDATPRRLVLRADGLLARQPTRTEEILGPPESAGEPAVEGFARKWGVRREALRIVETPKGRYYCLRRKVHGERTVDVLARVLPGFILDIPWPKTMYWTTKQGPRFIRPIRWLVALLGNQVVPFEIAGVRAGRRTSGHRRLGKRWFSVTIDTYEQRLRDNFVYVRAEERRRLIEDGIRRLLDGTGFQVKPDERLLQMLVYLTECPAPVMGTFSEEYLALPQEVLVTVMRHHQHYFSVLRSDGSLAPRFIAVMNIPDDPAGLVCSGNERVLRARFNDARFFWEVDQHKKLAERVDDLAFITFHAQLGSYLDKVRRMVRIVQELGGSELAQRAALLSKCDLTTEMVKEFPELQGIVGGLYARVQGEPEEVAQAIYEHYRPEGMDEPIPSTLEGRLVALADKIDTLRECFRIGLVPSGSKDPFALRRAAYGVVRILVEGELSYPLGQLLGDNEALREFMLDRVRYYLRDVRGFPYDEVNAVLAAGWDDLPDVLRRLEAVRSVRPTQDFEPIAASFKRVKNILRQANFWDARAVQPELLVAAEEQALYEAFVNVREQVAQLRDRRQYEQALLRIASLRTTVDQFFDRVLVMAPEKELRDNRLALLANLYREFSSIADFSEIATG